MVFGIALQRQLVSELFASLAVHGCLMALMFRLCCPAQACLDLKVQSQNDTKKLAEAKQQVYLKGFTDGVLLAGPHKGAKVRQAPAPSRTTAAA